MKLNSHEFHMKSSLILAKYLCEYTKYYTDYIQNITFYVIFNLIPCIKRG